MFRRDHGTIEWGFDSYYTERRTENEHNKRGHNATGKILSNQ